MNSYASMHTPGTRQMPYPPPFPPPPVPPPATMNVLQQPRLPFTLPPPNAGMPWQGLAHAGQFIPPPPWSSFPPPSFAFMPPPVWQGFQRPLGSNSGGGGQAAPSGMNDHRSHPDPVKLTEAEIDRTWIKKFVQGCEWNRYAQLKEERKRSITISEARRLHYRAHGLMKELEGFSDEMEGKFPALQAELNDILLTLSDEVVLHNLAMQVEKRRKRRKKEMDRRKQRYIEKRKSEKNQEDKRKEIEMWLMECRENEQRQMRDKEVQKQLDQCLQEVRQRRTRSKRSLELVNALAKLRKVRKESAIKKGLELSDDNDENFLTAHKTAKINLGLRLATCDEEESKLRLFIDGEQKEQEEKIKREQIKEAEEKRNQWNGERWQVLFGRKEELDEFNPMWPIQELHKQADTSLMAFASIRQQWDRFITTNPGVGTRIPVNWVDPVAPSSDVWERFMAEKT